MKILHLSDLHLKSDRPYLSRLNHILGKLIDSLNGDSSIDLILFTGDLLYSAKKKDEYDLFEIEFTEPLLHALNMEKSQFIFCGGNHDIYRGREMNAISEYISNNLTGNTKLDMYCAKEDDPQFLGSTVSMSHFLEYSEKFYSPLSVSPPDIVKKLYSIHRRVIGGKSIGFACINSFWRHLDDHSSGNLLFPPFIVSEIVSQLDDVDEKILLMHHSLEEFHEFNQVELEDLIYNEFLMLFSGHVHKKRQGLQLGSEIGIYCNTSPAVLTASYTYENIGYTIVDIDLLSFDCQITNSTFVKAEDKFIHAEPRLISIPVNEAKKELNNFRSLLRKNYIMELDTANNLFVSEAEHAEGYSFADLFVEPTLRTRPKTDVYDSLDDKYTFQYDKLLSSNDNHHILGGDKTGKSSLLKKIQLDLLAYFQDPITIPFFLDFKAQINHAGVLDLDRIIARYFKMSRNELLEKLEQFNFVVLVDNFERESKNAVQELITFFSDHPRTRLVLTESASIASSYDPDGLSDLKLKKVYIHDITRRQIRLLAEKWPSIPVERTEDVLNKITKIFDQLHLPYNFWTVSLFFWIFQKMKDYSLDSNFDLVQLYVDGLLGKDRISTASSIGTHYESYKLYLSDMAHHIVVEQYENNYTLAYEELVEFTKSYKDDHIRFIPDTETIVGEIIAKGILVKRDNGRYTFRLKGVFEYFIAFYMKNHSEFLTAVLSDKIRYLAFNNELELYAGFKRDDIEYLRAIFEITEKHFDSINNQYDSLGTPDNNLVSKITQSALLDSGLKQLSSESQSALLPAERDEIMDSQSPISNQLAAVERKEFLSSLEPTPENFEKIITILSRVFRNLDQITDTEFTFKVFNYLLNTYINYGFFLTDYFSDRQVADSETSEEDENSSEILFKLISNFIPLIVQVSMYESMGHNNLVRIINSELDTLKPDAKDNQYRYVLLTLLLADLDLESNIDAISNTLEIINITALENTVLIKLYYYLLFRTKKSSALEKTIKKKIQELTLQIYPGTKLGELHKRLERKNVQKLFTPK